MKINRVFLLAAASVLFANCAREEIDTPFKTGTAVAVMESDNTKSTVTDGGYFTWTKGDKIAIHTETGIIEGTLNGDGGSPEGTFSYSFVGEQTLTGYAMYPYSDQHSINQNSITFHMPAEYNLGETVSNTNAPMLAVPTVKENASVNYNFSHLGGVIRVVFKNAPVGTDKFTLSLGGSKINGDFTVADGVVETGQAAEGEGLTTLKFTALESVQDITLFVPVPTGAYNGIEAKLYKGEETLGTWGGSNAQNNVERRALVLMAPITFSNAGGNIENEMQVATETQLKDAVVNGGHIALTEGVTLTEDLTIPDGTEVVLDLNGSTIETEKTIIMGEGASLSIVNNAPAVAVKSSVEEPAGVTISSSSDIIKAAAESTINIGEGVNLVTTGEECCCIWIPNGAENVVVNTAGNLKAIAEGAAVVYHNGNLKTGTINITGGTITHEADVAVYIAGNADVTVSEGVKIEGLTAMEVRAGSLTVNGGEFVATASPSSYVPNGNGTTSKGVALAMCKHTTTENSLSVIINGGEFKGVQSILVNKDLGDVSLTINKGTFSDMTPLPYIADNGTFKLANNVEIKEAITIANDRDIIFDLNGYNVENKTAGHPSELTPNYDDECVVFMVRGKLTINDSSSEGKGCVKATGDGVNSDFNVAVWAMGSDAKVIINGGNYSNSKDTDNDGCDLIYARDGADIEINGGSFQSHVRSTLGGGVYDVLNCKDDNTGSKIIVNGGKYQNYVPSYENVGKDEVVLGENKSVYKENTEEEVIVAHSKESSDTWYVVR